MGRLFPHNWNMIGWVTLTTLSECHTKTNTKTRAKTKSKLKTTFPSIIAWFIGWIIKSSSNDYHTESKTKCTQLPYLNLKYLMAFLTRTVLSTFDIDTLSLPLLFLPKFCCYAGVLFELENQCWKDSAVLARRRCQEKELYLLRRRTTCWPLLHFIFLNIAHCKK